MENREIFQFYSLLLQYPDQEWINPLFSEDVREMVDEGTYQKINPFVQYLEQHPLDELQENYVNTFDFNEKTNLYLSYAKLKDERERGQILVELKQLYQDEGFTLNSDELPDYLPLFLEFTAIAEEETAKKLLVQYLPAMEYLKKELTETNSVYAFVLEALLLTIDQYIHQ